MERTEVLTNVISTYISYEEKQQSFKKVFLNEPVMSKAIEVFDTEMGEMINHIFDLMGIPDEESSNRYEKTNWTRDVCANLIKRAVKNKKYIEPAIELISDWENLNDYTSKVENHT